MARKPSDDVRDAKRALKIKNQAPSAIKTNKDGISAGWNASPTVSKSPSGSKLNDQGFRIDWDEKHHINGLNLYERFTEGMSAEQVLQVDDALGNVGLTKGNVGPNRIDLPRRLHTSSKYPGIEGAHQVTQRLGIDSPAELDRLSKLSPDERFQELGKFIKNAETHRTVGQQKYLEQFMLQPGNNSSTNVFGGNFSQQVLQTRDKAATAKAAKALKIERKALKGVGKLLGKIPLAGGIIAGGLVLAAGGTPAEAAGAALDAENPLDGGTVADGTLEANLNRMPKYGPPVPKPKRETSRQRANRLRQLNRNAANKAFNTPR